MSTFTCLDCEKDPTSIICSDCFDPSKHQGHRIIPKSNTSGCCDCGDAESWSEVIFLN